MVKKLGFLLLGLSLLASGVFADGDTPTKTKRADVRVKVTGRAIGPSQAAIDAARDRAIQSVAVQREISGKKYRLLLTEALDDGTPDPTQFRAVFYDYTADRTLVAVGDFAGKQPITVTDAAFQPIPSSEEFEEAVRIVSEDARFGTMLKTLQLKTFRPMPDVTILDGTIERLVNVGLHAEDPTTGRNEVVSVSIKRGSVIRYDSGAPPTSSAAPDACGIPNAGQSTTSRGTAGSAIITINDQTSGATLWQMTVVRPAASSGTRASAIEIQNVSYKGKSVLKRAHAPVLNVQYVGGQCGPYRDWQYQEGQFATPAAGNNDIAPGIRIVAAGQTASTALENGTDTGNFAGVAIYTSGSDVVFVTEMEAGWYRYISEWRFSVDGTIRPRFGFGATDNSCVCFAHNHHVYWRFDFDIVQPANKVFQVERGRKFMRPITNELFMNKRVATNKGIMVQNSNGDQAYEIMPTPSDGPVDAFGMHDFWVLRYKNVVGGTAFQNELDDGFNQTTSQNAFIQIDQFANNESVVDQDVVVWYGSHFLHNDAGNLTLNADRSGIVISGSHVVGPDLRPVRWY